jgi:integrase
MLVTGMRRGETVGLRWEDVVLTMLRPLTSVIC